MQKIESISNFILLLYDLSCQNERPFFDFPNDFRWQVLISNIPKTDTFAYKSLRRRLHRASVLIVVGNFLLLECNDEQCLTDRFNILDPKCYIVLK